MEFLKEDASVSKLYDLRHTIAAPFLERINYPWEILDMIGEVIREIGYRLPSDRYNHTAENIWIAKDAQIASNVCLMGAAILCSSAQLRQGALIRGNVIVGEGAVVGNSTELKNSILFDGVQVPHFNYVGDSILGYRAHMGAGAVISNVKSDRSYPVIRCADEEISLQRIKCGAFLGDFAEIGCGCVLNPGTVIGRRSSVYPLSSVRGCIPSDCICKGERGIVHRE